MPPYLAGRQAEIGEFEGLLDQTTILNNAVLTGLRGVGKTVLLELLRPHAIRRGWGWVGTNLSESASISEEHLATRLLTDLAVLTADVEVARHDVAKIGFVPAPQQAVVTLNFETLRFIHDNTPGLATDKLKAVLEAVHEHLPRTGVRGLVFAYDEAQNLADHAPDKQYPLSLLLDTFQSIQAKGIPFLLVLTGLPTLFPKLVEARTFSERMFRVLFLDRLDEESSRQAIIRPLKEQSGPVNFSDEAVAVIIKESGGYPYFIQFICREYFDALSQRLSAGERAPVPVHEILLKLDRDFFAGRWVRVTDRQRELLTVIAMLESCEAEFTTQEIVEKSKSTLAKSFSSSHVSQILRSLLDAGLVFKNRHGRYSFAVPLLGQFIRRQAR
ncbi:MAG: AAA family ATPase [Planctomycetota bacterium]